MHSPQTQGMLQITLPFKSDGGGSWTSQDSQRDTKDTEYWCSANAADVDTTRYNYLPPGMNIANQCESDQRNMPLSLAGTTDACNFPVSSSLSAGFTKLKKGGGADESGANQLMLVFGVNS
jgi:hypothetical protein